MHLKVKWKQLALCLAIPLAVGGLSAFLTRGNTELYDLVFLPPMAPPGWVFPVVWTILYVLMGLACYLVLTSREPPAMQQEALTRYGLQLAANFVWPLLFFLLEWYLASFLWLALLWVLVWRTYGAFRRISPPAGWLLVPYLVWVAFAGYLNLGIYLLN